MLRNAAVYLSGSVIAQALMLVAVPVLSRFYAPEDFGVFGIFSALVSILGVVACLRLNLAVPLPRSNHHAACVFGAGLFALLGVTATVLVLVVLGRHQVAETLGVPELGALLWLLPLSVFGYGLYELLNYWSTRRNRFSTLAGSQVLRAGGVAGTQIGGAHVIGGGLGLVLGQLVGQWLASAVLLLQTLREDARLLSSGFSPKHMLAQAMRYRAFGLYGSAQAVLNATSQVIPVIMLGWFFSPVIVGFYVMAQRVISTPMSLISQSLRQAMLPHFSQQRQSGKPLLPLLRKYTVSLGALGLPAVFLLAFYGKELFGFVLGEEWREAGDYAGWLVLWLWAGMANPPSIVVLTVLEKQRLQSVYELLLLISRTLVLISAIWTGSAIMTVIMFSLVGMIFNLSLIWIAYAQCRK